MEGTQGLLPAFNDDGALPPGDYVLTLNQLAQSYLVDRAGMSASLRTGIEAGGGH